MLLDEYPSPPDNASLLNLFMSPEEATNFNAYTDSLLSPPNEDSPLPCYADVLEFRTWTVTWIVLDNLLSGTIYILSMPDTEGEIAPALAKDPNEEPPDSDYTAACWLNIVPVREQWGAIQYPLIVSTDFNEDLFLRCRIYHPWYGNGQITELPYITAKYVVFNAQFESFGYRAGPFHATFITHQDRFTLLPPPPAPANAAAMHTWWKVVRSFFHPTPHTEPLEAEPPRELELLAVDREMIRQAEMERYSSIIYSYTYSSRMPKISPSSREYGVSPHYILM
ncbi:uncharacterized protein ARMOST_04508 [Armillaria ostoyae]|uniref:Uncharacterized protein n=1 Tax=Armillaria ostoyae TaxID=47428 RepID=A0A284QXK4_ARMOS|nr:uncharacterized protein ARMOST_04508 [Armillaria ostoyae]